MRHAPPLLLILFITHIPPNSGQNACSGKTFVFAVVHEDVGRTKKVLDWLNNVDEKWNFAKSRNMEDERLYFYVVFFSNQQTRETSFSSSSRFSCSIEPVHNPAEFELANFYTLARTCISKRNPVCLPRCTGTGHTQEHLQFLVDRILVDKDRNDRFLVPVPHEERSNDITKFRDLITGLVRRELKETNCKDMAACSAPPDPKSAGTYEVLICKVPKLHGLFKVQNSTHHEIGSVAQYRAPSGRNNARTSLKCGSQAEGWYGPVFRNIPGKCALAPCAGGSTVTALGVITGLCVAAIILLAVSLKRRKGKRVALVKRRIESLPGYDAPASPKRVPRRKVVRQKRH